MTQGSEKKELNLRSGLDWIQGFVRIGTNRENWPHLDALLSEIFGRDPTDEHPWGGRQKYSWRQNYGDGVDLLEPESFTGELYLVIRGEPLAAVADERQMTLWYSLQSWGFRVTRIDPRVDDFTFVVDPNWLWTEYAQPRKFAGFKKRSRNDGDGKHDREGCTIYFGSREAGTTVLRVYDKSAESGGQVNAVRWELQIRDDKADAAARHLDGCGTTEEFGRRIAGMVFGAIDFYDDMTEKNAQRRPVPNWWRLLKHGADGVKLGSRPRVAETLAHVMKTIELMAGPQLFMVKRYLEARGRPHWFAKWLGKMCEKRGAVVDQKRYEEFMARAHRQANPFYNRLIELGEEVSDSKPPRIIRKAIREITERRGEAAGECPF